MFVSKRFSPFTSTVTKYFVCRHLYIEYITTYFLIDLLWKMSYVKTQILISSDLKHIQRCPDFSLTLLLPVSYLLGLITQPIIKWQGATLMHNKYEIIVEFQVCTYHA